MQSDYRSIFSHSHTMRRTFFFDCDFEQQQQQPTIFYGNENDLAARCDLNKSFTWFRYNYMLFLFVCVCVYLTLLKRSIEAAI